MMIIYNYSIYNSILWLNAIKFMHIIHFYNYLFDKYQYFFDSFELKEEYYY